MIKRSKAPGGTRVTFVLDSDAAVSVVGDFNDWDALAHPLKPRTNGTRSVAVVLPAGSRTCFRYLEDGGRFFDDPDADLLEDNGWGATHGVLVVPDAGEVATAAARPRRSTRKA
jgi:1,4-alpha-glucan branching enzyme